MSASTKSFLKFSGFVVSIALAAFAGSVVVDSARTYGGVDPSLLMAFGVLLGIPAVALAHWLDARNDAAYRARQGSR